MMFLLGKQAMFGHDPPMYLRSTTATRFPSPANVHAATVEPVPPPSMTKSNSSGCIFSLAWAGETSLVLFTRRLQDHVNHEVRLRVHRSVVHALRPNAGTHAIGHETLGLWVNHAVFFCEQEPGGLRFPSRCRRWFFNTPKGNRSLYCSHDAYLVS